MMRESVEVLLSRAVHKSTAGKQHVMRGVTVDTQTDAMIALPENHYSLFRHMAIRGLDREREHCLETKFYQTCTMPAAAHQWQHDARKHCLNMPCDELGT
jgi:hypothetical protein